MPESATFDTHAWVKRLEDAGVPERQAEAHVALFATEVERRLVTRDHFDAQRAADREHLDHRMTELRSEIKNDLLALEHRLTIQMIAVGGAVVAVLSIVIGLFAFLA